ncbi:6-carboxytetrahydropterin synthase QueD [Candidatus Peregrinibacteria bacterium]|nr:MAG: 6-carboxytetrahydropterin synthase QueD [Candidatus Peregrinibacteria bacterium]
MLVGKEFTFDAAHFLPQYYGKCERMHGHTYKLRVVVEGKVGENGLVIDFVILKRIVKRQVLDLLDHQVINDVIKIASCENTAQWIWEQLSDLETLIQQELDDPNLPDSITKYFNDQNGEGMDTSEFSDQVRLHEVTLWETPTSFASYQGSL